MMPDFLAAYLHAGPERYGLPAHFHAALVQGYFVAIAQGAPYTPATADIYLRDYILSHTRDAKSALFLSEALIAHLNAPSTESSALPMTRFMRMIHGALSADTAASFNLQQVPDCVRFYHVFMGELAAAYHFPRELVPESLGSILQRAGLAVPPASKAVCRVIRETDFKSLTGFTNTATLIGPADVENGLGAGMRYMADGLKAAQINFSILNRYASSNNRAADTRYGGFETSTATSPINILHFNSDMLAENLLMSGAENFTGRYTIGYFFWETSTLSEAHRIGLGMVDEIWVATEFMRELYAAVTDKPVKNLGCVIQPPSISLSKQELPVPPGSMDGFTFVFTYDSASRATRKNPLGAVRAFRTAFPGGEPVRLLIKTQNANQVSDPIERALFAQLQQAASADPRITIINATWRAAEIAALLAAADCYISLHRAEGLGLGIVESMQLGKPVIATGWSGSADFVTESTAYPVPSRLVKIDPGHYHYAYEGTHFWAEPDTDKAAEYMQRVFTQSDEAKTRAAAGQAFIKTHYSPSAIGQRMATRLAEIMSQL